jgi:cellulose synthase/poly-beta-1,6-N-acetylglucosamine synthase-like glycosyltransferase
VVYTYVGYGAVLWALLKVKNKMRPSETIPMPKEDDLPYMTLMITAWNEEDVVIEKMANVRALDYPKDRLVVMWVTDGSDDGTNDLLQQYPEVKLVYSPERRGKAAAMKHGLQENKTPIVVFTDANTMLNSGALKEIGRLFADPKVGCVSGEKRVTPKEQAGGESNEVALGEGLYWRYESTLKRWDSQLYSAMGAAGELFAVRMSCYEEAPSNALLDDFMISMLILRKGYRIAYTADAYAVENGSANMEEEGKRKRRIAAGGLQSCWWLKGMMNPFRNPVVAFQFVSHRVLRWTITPLALLALIPINVALVLANVGWIYTVSWGFQVLFYFAALIGRPRAIRYFLFMNMNVFRGVTYLWTHRTSGVWEKSRRA